MNDMDSTKILIYFIAWVGMIYSFISLYIIRDYFITKFEKFIKILLIVLLCIAIVGLIWVYPYWFNLQ